MLKFNYDPLYDINYHILLLHFFQSNLKLYDKKLMQLFLDFLKYFRYIIYKGIYKRAVF